MPDTAPASSNPPAQAGEELLIGEGQRLATLGRLAAGMAHDFNNVLGIISNNAHMLRDHAGNEEAQALVDSTLRAIDTGSQLTRQLLRLSASRPPQPQRIDLVHYLPEVQGLLRVLLKRRVAISVDVEPDTAAVRADLAGLELALISLGLDARDATPRGGNLKLLACNAGTADLNGVPPLQAPQRWVLLTVAGPSTNSLQTAKLVQALCQQAGGVARMPGELGRANTVTLLLPSSP